MMERTELIPLTRVDCLHLLAAHGLGRVVFTTSAMPAVQPVRYVLHGDEVVFQVTDGGPLSTATRHAVVVGFQVDDIDPVTHAGWSVLGVGQAYEITDADHRWYRPPAPPRTPWPCRCNSSPDNGSDSATPTPEQPSGPWSPPDRSTADGEATSASSSFGRGSPQWQHRIGAREPTSPSTPSPCAGSTPSSSSNTPLAASTSSA